MINWYKACSGPFGTGEPDLPQTSFVEGPRRASTPRSPRPWDTKTTWGLRCRIQHHRKWSTQIMTPKLSRGGCSPVCIGPASTPKQACLLTDLRTELSGQPNPKSPVHKLPLPWEAPATCQSSPCSNRSLAWGPRGQSPGPHGRPGSPTGWILRPAPARCSHSPLQLRLGARPLDSRRAATLRGRHPGS